MTLTEANKILSGKLTFGDPDQIKAVRFIEQVNEAVKLFRACDRHDKENGQAWGWCECVERFPEAIKTAGPLSLKRVRSKR